MNKLLESFVRVFFYQLAIIRIDEICSNIKINKKNLDYERDENEKRGKGEVKAYNVCATPLLY